MQSKERQIPGMLEDLGGQIERITYRNEESGFTIAKVKTSEGRGLITVVGNLAAPTPGEVIEMQGEWSNHPKYGEQFKVSHYRSIFPATVSGIEKYLSSGLIKGIGPVMAKRIVKKFGMETLDVIEHDMEKIANIEGIGRKRIDMIQKAWADQKEIREIMLFLQSHDISSGYATKIFKYYGKKSIEVVRENPYRLATDIFGIGFLTADRIAEKLGFSKDSQLRAESGVLYVLQQTADEGHVFCPYESLAVKCQEILQIEQDVIIKAFGILAATRKIVIEDQNSFGDKISEGIKGDMDEHHRDHKVVYLAKFHIAETSVAERLITLRNTPKPMRNIDSERAIARVQGRLAITLAENQVDAVRCALEEKAMIITGGPGTGKTTIIKAILNVVAAFEVNTLLSAPTGRAAKRMKEATGQEAKTIHRMLEYSMAKRGFLKNEKNPLQCDLLIIDEASMIDNILMHHLMNAVPAEATLILIGDVNQLPSVGPGNILKDIIASGIIRVVEFDEIFRQAQESLIVVNAHKINNGLLPAFQSSAKKLQDFYFIEQKDPQEVVRVIVDLTRERIPNRFGLDPIEEIQVLTPMYKGIIGADNLNRELQKALNPADDILSRGGKSFRINDKVMQIRNNYIKEVFNGDIGRIADINGEDHEVVITFDNLDVVYDYTEMDEIILAYSVSIHKSQGSEYPAVIIPLLTEHYMLLQRNLIYTALTRAKRLVVIVGTKKALAIGVQNKKTQLRYTSLGHRLNQGLLHRLP